MTDEARFGRCAVYFMNGDEVMRVAMLATGTPVGLWMTTLTPEHSAETTFYPWHRIQKIRSLQDG
jgi:hypothetical protein